MMLWAIFAIMTGATTGALLGPLFRQSAPIHPRLRLAAITMIVIVLPVATMILYFYLGTPGRH